MARLTRLYQAPRSPLIYGRTRRERPLWQAWVSGSAVGGLALAAWYAVSVAGSVPAWFIPGLGWLAFAVLAGAGVGTIVASVLGWHVRWAAAAVLSVACMGLAGVVLANAFGR